MPRGRSYDRWLFLTTGLLVVAGLFMVGSASNYYALDSGMSPSAFWWKQALYVLLGFSALIAMLSFPYDRLDDRWLVITGLLVCLGGLIVVLAMPAVGGSHRWFPIGPFKLQPSELAKLVIVLFMAYMLSRKEDRVNETWAVAMPCMVVTGTLAALIVIEPDLGSGVMLVAVACVMIFVAGLRSRLIFGVAAIGAVGFALSVLAQPYRLERIKAFLDPSADTLGSSFQLNQSLIAIGTGGLAGIGFGQGTQKAFYLPAAHTDFIFSVVGEEKGLLGCGLLLLAFLVLFWRGMRAANRAPDRFGFYLALGMTNLLVLQALINMCVCLGMLPTKGLPLPFISYGGSSLVTSMAAMGLLLNVSQHSN